MPGDESVVVFNGDVLSSHNLALQIQEHEANNADATLHLTAVQDARSYGCVPTDSDGRVSAFLEKWKIQLQIPSTPAAMCSNRQ